MILVTLRTIIISVNRIEFTAKIKSKTFTSKKVSLPNTIRNNKFKNPLQNKSGKWLTKPLLNVPSLLSFSQKVKPIKYYLQTKLRS